MSSSNNKVVLRPRGTGSLPVSYPATGSSLNSTSNNNNNSTTDNLFPLISTCGYLTKKSRGLTSRWLRRWWQLLGDGTLIYFKGEERLKVLGEIDIAHTCYDVQLGGEFCHMSFPPVIPSNCCLSVSVLKRTYYLFAPTPQEASKWAESLQSASYILNRNRPRELSANPAVLVAEEELEATPPPPPSVPPPPTVYKPPPPPPPLSSSIDESTEGEDEHKQLPSFSQQQQLSRNHHNLSVPDLRFDYSAGSKYSNNRAKSVYNSLQTSQFSSSQSSNSPPQQSSQPSPPQPSQSTPANQSGGAHYRRRRSHSFLMTPEKRDEPTQDRSTSSNYYYSKKLSFSNHATGKSDSTRHKQSRRGSGEGKQSHKHVNKRSSLNNNWHTSHSDLLRNSTLPSPGQLSRSKWKSEYDAMAAIDSSTYTRLEELQKQEEAIKKRLRELQKTERASYIGPAHGIPVLPLSPTENISPSSYPFLSDNTPNHFLSSQYEPNGYHDDYDEADAHIPGTVHFRKAPPKKPPRKAPKPLKRIQTPYTALDNENIEPQQDTSNTNTYTNTQAASTTVYSTNVIHTNTITATNTIYTSSTPSSIMSTALRTNDKLSYKDDSHTKSSAIRYHEANIWVKAELSKLIEQIKLHGTLNKNNKIIITFGTLMEKTEGMFEALLGTVLTARKHKIVDFEGDILLKGEHDSQVITLLVQDLIPPPTIQGHE